LAAERADWVLLAGRAVDRVAPLVSELRARGSAARGRPAAVAWNPSVAWTAPLIDEIRAHLSYMVVDMPPAERVALGLDDDRVAQLRELVNTRGPNAAAALIPEPVLARYAVAGPRAAVVARLGELLRQVRPELLLFEAGDYSAAFLESAASLALDAGAQPFHNEAHAHGLDSYRRP
jgi:hypothetical protein